MDFHLCYKRLSLVFLLIPSIILGNGLDNLSGSISNAPAPFCSLIPGEAKDIKLEYKNEDIVTGARNLDGLVDELYYYYRDHKQILIDEFNGGQREWTLLSYLVDKATFTSENDVETRNGTYSDLFIYGSTSNLQSTTYATHEGMDILGSPKGSSYYVLNGIAELTLESLVLESETGFDILDSNDSVVLYITCENLK